MYFYVEDKAFLKKAQNECSELIKELESRLRSKGINTQFFLVGSGGRNMVTQNERQPIDFDYNINVISSERWDARWIKETIRKTLNEVLRGRRLDDCDDSTSSLTTKAFHFNGEDSEFSIDVCIVAMDENGNWNRLIHQKTGIAQNDCYFWNIAPNSKEYNEKARQIKSIPGWWEEVRDQYLKIKNRYLTSNDHSHPSFVCYIEAINNVYNRMRQKGILR